MTVMDVGACSSALCVCLSPSIQVYYGSAPQSLTGNESFMCFHYVMPDSRITLRAVGRERSWRNAVKLDQEAEIYGTTGNKTQLEGATYTNVHTPESLSTGVSICQPAGHLWPPPLPQSSLHPVLKV